MFCFRLKKQNSKYIGHKTLIINYFCTRNKQEKKEVNYVLRLISISSCYNLRKLLLTSFNFSNYLPLIPFSYFFSKNWKWMTISIFGKELVLMDNYWSELQQCTCWKMTKLSTADSNLGKNSVRLSNPGPFHENYTKLYFDVKHLKRGFSWGWWN